MSRRVTPFQAPCHAGDEWTCMGCERVVCATCEPSPAEFELCDQCYYEDGAA